jgi:CCAAT/enhancer binding protein (C/EBP), gamma
MFSTFQAVKRSRVKSKMKTEETVGRVNELRVKNEVLEEKIDNLSKELKFLKELFLAQAQAKSDKLSNVDLKALLADMDSDDEADADDGEKPGTSKS